MRTSDIHGEPGSEVSAFPFERQSLCVCRPSRTSSRRRDHELEYPTHTRFARQSGCPKFESRQRHDYLLEVVSKPLLSASLSNTGCPAQVVSRVLKKKHYMYNDRVESYSLQLVALQRL